MMPGLATSVVPQAFQPDMMKDTMTCVHALLSRCQPGKADVRGGLYVRLSSLTL
jgi:hypothetical protein